MQTHSRRRKAIALAALSLAATGAVFGQAEGAPGAAKEPRPASDFRLGRQSVESRHVKNGSLVLKDFKKRQVFSYKAGRKLTRTLPTLQARIADTYTKAQADQIFLTKAGAGGLLAKDEANKTFLTQAGAAPFLTDAEADALFLTPAEGDAAFLTPAEADAAYAKKGDIGVSKTSVLAGTALVPFASETTVLEIPGVGTIRGVAGSSGNQFRLATASATPFAVNHSDGGAGSASSTAPYSVNITPGDVIGLQLVGPGGQIVSLLLSAEVGAGSPRRMTAQVTVTSP